MPDAGSGVEEAGDWRLIVSRKGPRRSAQDVAAFKSASIPRWLLGRCCRCLLRMHRAESCCAPPPLPRPAAAPTALQAPPWIGCGWEDPDLHTLLQPPASPIGMPRMGDASMRPDDDFVVVPATPEMQDEAAILSSNSVVPWLEGARQDISCRQVAAELATALGARIADVEVVKHYPEQFLVRFIHQHHCTDVVSLGDIHAAGHRIFVREWHREAHADNEDQLHHVCLYLEGVPLHSWNQYVVTFLIGRGYSLDYIEPQSLRKEDTRDMALLA
ncbi:hypothetical protein D1007_41054 [Hordeum vulgare]|nr:hypothetical protein D1007_41054 [Hordeum vulgare]